MGQMIILFLSCFINISWDNYSRKKMFFLPKTFAIEAEPYYETDRTELGFDSQKGETFFRSYSDCEKIDIGDEHFSVNNGNSGV